MHAYIHTESKILQTHNTKIQQLHTSLASNISPSYSRRTGNLLFQYSRSVMIKIDGKLIC